MAELKPGTRESQGSWCSQKRTKQTQMGCGANHAWDLTSCLPPHKRSVRLELGEAPGDRRVLSLKGRPAQHIPWHMPKPGFWTPAQAPNQGGKAWRMMKVINALTGASGTSFPQPKSPPPPPPLQLPIQLTSLPARCFSATPPMSYKGQTMSFLQSRSPVKPGCISFSSGCPNFLPSGQSSAPRAVAQ